MDNEHEMEGRLKATEKHLSDMQKIVFKQLKIAHCITLNQ